MSFGWSAGDIASAISILIDVVQALDEADGASADYRKVSTFLASLTSTLSTLQILSNMPAALSVSLSDKIKEIQEPVEQFQENIKKYKEKLGVPPTTGFLQHFRHVKTKLRWHYGPMKEVAKLNDQIGRQLQVLDTALLQVISTSVLRLPSDLRPILEDIVNTQLKGFEEKVIPMITRIADEQDSQGHHYKSLLLFLQTTLPLGTGALEGNQIEANSLQTKILDTLRGFELNQDQGLRPNKELTARCPAEKALPVLSVLRKWSKDISRWISDAKIALHVKTLMFFILVSLQYLLSNFWTVLNRVSYGMSRIKIPITVRNNVFFNDAIGRNWKLHTDFVRSFKVFNCFLEEEFQGEAGLQWVQRGLYQLSDDESGRYITPQTWKSMIKPGKTFSMSMVVEVIAKSQETYISTCPAHPYCTGTVMRIPGTDWTKCSICEIDVYIPGRRVEIPEEQNNRVVEIDDESGNAETLNNLPHTEESQNKKSFEAYGPMPPPGTLGPPRGNLNTSHITRFRRITQKIVYQPPYEGIVSLVLYLAGSDTIWVDQALGLGEMLVNRERTSTKIVALPNTSDTGQYDFAEVNAAISEHLTVFGRRNILLTVCFCGAPSGPIWTAIGIRNANGPQYLLSQLEELDADVLFTHFTERQALPGDVGTSSFELPPELPLGSHRAMAITSLASDIQQTLFSSTAGRAPKSITRDVQSLEELTTDNNVEATLHAKEYSNDGSKRSSAPFESNVTQQKHTSKDGIRTESTASKEPPSHLTISTPPVVTDYKVVTSMTAQRQGWYVRHKDCIPEEDDQLQFAHEQLSNRVKDSRDRSPRFDFALGMTTRDDLQEALVFTKRLYERERPGSMKLEKYLAKLISRTLYLSNTMEVFVLHRPEYIGLLWSSIKVLILTAVNHEKILYQFSKGLVGILDCFPRSNLCLALYPTATIQAAVGKLYTTFVGFLCKAFDWMRGAHFRHILSSITRPAELDFQSSIEDVAEISKAIDAEASSMARAEIKEMHFKISGIQAAMKDLPHLERLTNNAPVPDERGSVKDEASFESFSLHAQVSLGRGTTFVPLNNSSKNNAHL
ncbi:hypothetical protein VTL71DRAFT_3672 [Oculimacula yallundae]|uniref:Fungal N-terminal domain-containing protein n=1 Tax=Oculimacula yallundae TaxID=86028 RepID=A0ABR4C3Q0_9HELO